MNGPNRDYIEKMAAAEDASGSMSVGGMSADLGILTPEEIERSNIGALQFFSHELGEEWGDIVPTGSCEYCGVDVFDNHELCDQCEWWCKQ